MFTSRQPKQYFAAMNRAVVGADAAEWTELSSPAQRVVHRGVNDSEFMATSSFGTVWDATTPAALDPAPMSQPFCERIEGLATREVSDPGVFQHFFGPGAER